jgi:hypothetical protein
VVGRRAGCVRASELRALEVLGFGLRSCGGGELCNCRGRGEKERVSVGRD